MVLLYLLILCAYLALVYFLATLAEKVAKLKGYGPEYHILGISFWLGVIGWTYVYLLPDLVERKNQEELIEVQKKIYLSMNSESVLLTEVMNEEDDELPPL